MRFRGWTLELIALGCGGNEPAPVEPQPAPVASNAPPSDVVDASVEAPDAAGVATLPPPKAPEGPKADNPGWVEVSDVNHEKLADGFYFVDGNVLEVPCKACERPPTCKPGGNCPKTEDCSFCEPVLQLEDSGANAGFAFEDRLVVPKFQKKQRVRVVFERRGSARLFVRQSQPCSPSECLETDPPMKLERAGKGKAVRRDGARCYAKSECPPNAKCDPDRETRVRCP